MRFGVSARFNFIRLDLLSTHFSSSHWKSTCTIMNTQIKGSVLIMFYAHAYLVENKPGNSFNRFRFSEL